MIVFLFVLTFVLGFILGWGVYAYNATTPCPDCNEGERDEAWGLLQEASLQLQDPELVRRIHIWTRRIAAQYPQEKK